MIKGITPPKQILLIAFGFANELILQGMIASVDGLIASIIVVAHTLQKAWALLHSLYANRSHRVYSLRDQLTSITKQTKSVVKYLQQQIKTIIDILTIISSLITSDGLTIKILYCLHLEY
ncbi:hypothetical protein CXB51_024824 [Gossypium anomalum]|uniref:Uncharacterized protein n=1 Tax=Gossypium anomalum TaxID=47600 RepID=A0A8J5Y9P1_9ROSI|nr:hypothetical protein CXB51_024824 [Gossypium anomalum]